jgi:quinol monooxygenase YgiN
MLGREDRRGAGDIRRSDRPQPGRRRRISFDIGRDLADPNSIIATEVFEDRAALDRQESLPVVQKTIGQLERFVAAPPEVIIFNV